MTGRDASYSKIPIIIKICKTEALEMFSLLLFRIEVVWKHFNLQDVGSVTLLTVCLLCEYIM